MERFLRPFHLSWPAFISFLPALIGSIVCFLATIFLANFISKLVSRYSMRRAKDTLIANFIAKIAWSVIFIVGSVLTLGILGLGTISNKILAGAGITTFVIGFALKDIGENFLAGIIIAFSRPYRLGNFIECTGVKGVVKDMSMRQTTVETDDGKIIMIPNSSILKNPLIKYYNDDNNMRQEFQLNVDTVEVQKAIEIINETVSAFDFIKKEQGKPVKVIVNSLSGDKVKLTIIFWLDYSSFKGSRSGTRSQVILTVLNKLREAEIKFNG